ncbi:hypothetical protein APHAL10511_002258 [Amanita phalloides]|nr:hypothetical protein APHAL10511_002258 [Amanita phalloides]
MLSLRFQTYATTSVGPNAAIVELLKHERDAYSKELDADGYRIRAFSNAIKVIERLEKPITSAKDAMRLKGIGVGIADRIGNFLEPQHLADHSRPSEKRRTLLREQLKQIPGLGLKRVEELIDKGCRGIADLRSRKFMPMLSKKQQVFVKYFEHMNKPVMREEAEIVVKFMQENLSSKFEIIIAGDYRRGLSSFPILNILLLHSEHVHVPIPDPPRSQFSYRLSQSFAIKQKYISAKDKLTNPLHGDLVPNLINRGLVCDTAMSGERKWGGVIRVPELVQGTVTDGEQTLVWRSKHERLKDITVTAGTFRQMDVVLAPQKSRAAALLSMTGDPEFVRYIKYKALNLGLHLDEFGVWKWHSVENGEPAKEPVMGEDNNRAKPCGYWELLQASSEKDIFSLLGMEHVLPQRRNFAYLRSGKGRED